MAAILKYPLQENGEKRVELSWNGMWNDIRISFDGQLLGIIKDKRELQTGKEFQLPDSSKLSVQLAKGAFAPELRILRNGQPLPGTANSPDTILKAASFAVYELGVLYLLVGLAAMLFNVTTLLVAGIGPVQIVAGLIFLLCGYFARKGSLIALLLPTALITVNLLYALPRVAPALSFYGCLGLMLPVWLAIPMVRAFDATQRLKQWRKQSGTGATD